jgi:hypothetical protein
MWSAGLRIFGTLNCIIGYMSKKPITLMAVVGMTVGGAAPMLFGDTALLDAWGILGGFVGGIVGIWLGVIVAKRFG